MKQPALKSALLALLSVIFICITPVRVIAQNNFKLFDYWKYYSDADNALYKHLVGIATEQIHERKKIIEALDSKDEMLQHQEAVREKLYNLIGPFPEKTPLNATITGKLKGNGFTVEKVLFESQPRFYVTAAMFIPNKRKGKLPAIIYCSGHTWEGFRSITYQHIIMNLVKKGFIVFAFDPIGQGERLQYFDETHQKSMFRSPTHEHSYAGAQCFITGSSMAKYMIWDGIRSVDYLLTRKEVDPERIGINGRSGGGTQSSYIAAFDPRIKALAPENYITSFERILKSIGPQDAEQNFPGGIANGIDHADLLEVRAPKPALIISTYNDFFSFQGVQDTYNEVKDYYNKMGVPDAVNMVVDEGGHQSTVKNREALYAFFQKYLDLPGSSADLETIPFSHENLYVTETGQVSTSLRPSTVFSLNKKEATSKMESIQHNRFNNPTHRSDVTLSARQLSGFEDPPENKEIIHSGRIVTDSMIVTRYLIKGSGDYYLPVLHLALPSVHKNNIILYFDPDGKEKAISETGEVIQLIKKGYQVVIADVPGTGELGPGYLTGDAYIGKISYNQWFAGVLTGKSISAIRSQDMIIIYHGINRIDGLSGTPITVVAKGFLATDLTHAAAFMNEFEDVVLINPLFSWELLVTNEHYDTKLIPSAVSYALTQYDLPDLMSCIAPRNLTIVNPLDHMGLGLGLEQEQVADDISYMKNTWEKTGAPGNLRIIKDSDFQISSVVE